MTPARALLGVTRRWGLAKRISLLSVGLLLLIQIAVQLVLRTSIENSVERNLRSELESSANVWTRLIEQNAQRLQLGGSILAADFGFRAAVASNDAETIESALENSATRIGATVAALMDTQFSTRAVAMAEKDPRLSQTLEQLARELSADPQKSRTILLNGRLHQFVLIPVRAPVLIGWIVMGFAVDQALAKDMLALTNTHVLLIQKNAPGEPQLLHSSLPSSEQPNLADLSGNTGSLQINDSDFAFRRLQGEDDKSAVEIVLLASKSAARKVFERTKVVLLVIDVIGLLLFALGSMELARRVSKPLTLLVADAVRLGRGDYSKKIDDMGRQDEIGNFARSFDQMRQDIQASQEEVQGPPDGFAQPSPVSRKAQGSTADRGTRIASRGGDRARSGSPETYQRRIGLWFWRQGDSNRRRAAQPAISRPCQHGGTNGRRTICGDVRRSGSNRGTRANQSRPCSIRSPREH